MFDVEAAKKAGASEDQIINYLTQSRKYDVQGALSAGADKNQIIGYLSTSANKEIAKPKEPNAYGATFRSDANDTGLQAGLKAAGNLPSSALNLGKGIYSAVRHPLDTVNGISNVLLGGVAKGVDKLTGVSSPDKYTQTFDALTNSLKERYGSLENLKKTATEDPVGIGSDIVGLFTGGASLLGKGAEAENLLSKAGQLVTKPIESAAGKVASTVGKTTKFAVSQATGLNPETITQLVKNPSSFKGVTPEIRIETANAVKDALDNRLGELSDLGKGYQSIREGAAGNPGLVTIQPDTIKTVLNKYGVKLDEGNKIVTSPESRPLSAGDRTALQDFIDNYGSVTNHTNNSFLNTREALSNLAKYDSSKTSLSTQISRDLRHEYDLAGKTQIPGLKELDLEYAPERQLLGSLKKEIFDPTGELKPNAISKIANINGRGKEKLLAKMKEIIPDIDQRVRIIKAVEDIENTKGVKVGTYSRTLTQAGGVIGGLTGNIPAVIAAIISQPEIAVPLLKGAGYVGEKATPILNALKTIANDINSFKIPSSLLNENGEAKAGLSIADVTKKIHPDDIQLMQEFIDSIRLKGQLSEAKYLQVEKLAERFGISMDKGINAIANKFDDILQGNTDKIKGTKIPGSVKSNLSLPSNKSIK
jgi:hypothetical protein